jgi:tetratricopeptide (TPR) repeat protein
LSLATEADGVARAARIAALSSALVERAPVDAWACLMLARAALQMGDKARALDHLGRVQALAPQSVFAAEAQRGCFALSDPQAAMEVDSILRAGYSASGSDLEGLSARARSLATMHAVWSTWFTVGIVERRRERWRAAREAFERAVTLAPGSTPAHVELVGACVALGDSASALLHAERVCALDGQTPRTLSVLATALLAGGKREEAEVIISQALRLDPSDASNVALAERIRERPQPPPGLLARWRWKVFGAR